MTRTRRNEVIVGSFVLLAFGALLGMTALIRGTSGLNPYVLHCQYENVAGLEIGSAVLVSGFRLGRVSAMEHISTEDGQPAVVVTLKVSREIPIRRDAAASLVQQGFLGDMRIEVHPGSDGEPEVDDGFMLKSLAAGSLTGTIASAEDIVADAGAAMKRIRDLVTDEKRMLRIDEAVSNVADLAGTMNTLLEENREDIRATIANAREVSDSARGAVEEAEELMSSVRRRADELGGTASETLEEIRGSVASMKERLETITTRADEVGDSAERLIAEVREKFGPLAASVTEASSNAAEILSGIREGRGTVGRLMSDSSIFEDIRAGAAAMRSFFSGGGQTVHNRTPGYEAAPAETGER